MQNVRVGHSTPPEPSQEPDPLDTCKRIQAEVAAPCRAAGAYADTPGSTLAGPPGTLDDAPSWHVLAAPEGAVGEGGQYASEQGRCRSLLARSEVGRTLAAALVHHRRDKGRVPGAEPYGSDVAYACLEAAGQDDLAAGGRDERALYAGDEVVAAVEVETMIQVVVAEGVEMEVAVVAQLAPVAPGAPCSTPTATCAAPKAPPPSEEGEVEV